MHQLDALISQLEKAAGPDGDLDFAISQAVWGEGTVRFSSVHMPYTSSIDAASTLVPIGWEWQVNSNAEDSPGNEYFIGPFAMCEDIKHHARLGAGGGGATPALALCVAALKSRRCAALGE